jgi:uncharacterized membrane protein YeiH
LAVFTALGTDRALAVTDSAAVSILMGMSTGVAGGLVRDVLSAEVPLILRREIYATASLIGAVLFVLLARAGVDQLACAGAAMATVLALRLAAIRWRLALPVFTAREDPRGE